MVAHAKKATSCGLAFITGSPVLALLALAVNLQARAESVSTNLGVFVPPGTEPPQEEARSPVCPVPRGPLGSLADALQVAQQIPLAPPAEGHLQEGVLQVVERSEALLSGGREREDQSVWRSTCQTLTWIGESNHRLNHHINQGTDRDVVIYISCVTCVSLCFDMTPETFPPSRGSSQCSATHTDIHVFGCQRIR